MSGYQPGYMSDEYEVNFHFSKRNYFNMSTVASLALLYILLRDIYSACIFVYII